jgi:hypothetical protein
MTGTEICTAAREFAPLLQLRDVWFLMKQLQNRGLATCLNPEAVTGKLFCLTDRGGAVLLHGFGQEVRPVPDEVDWSTYSWVVLGTVRKAVLLEVGLHRLGEERLKTAARIRQNLRDRHPLSLNLVIRALQELRQRHLIRCVGETPRRHQKLYRLTRDGERMQGQLLR